MTFFRPIGSELVALAQILEFRARDTPESLAFGAGGENLTYRALREDAQLLGAALLHSGVTAGDRVAMLVPAGLDIIRLVFALQRIAASPCVFDPSIPPATSARRAARIRPRLVVVGGPAAGELAASARSAGMQALSTMELFANATSLPLPPLPSDPEAIAFLQPTSGTTGEPRAAMVRQRNVIASLHAARELLDPGPSDVLVGWVPPWHDLGMLRFLLGPVYFGVPCHLVPPAVRTISQWLETIFERRGTITGAPDFAWRLATRLVDAGAVDLSSLRFATNGGEPVRASTITAFESRFGLNGVIRPGYGLAEATLGVTSVRAGESLRVGPGGNVSCGRPLENVEVRVKAEGAGAGEILVRGPAVFAGYFDAEEASAAVLRNGWLYTGDFGSLDGDGNLYVLGRDKAMLKRGGAPLAPREIEEAAQSVPGVRIAAAIAMLPSPEAITENIVLVVEAEPDENGVLPTPARVAGAVEHSIGFAPDRVVFVAPRAIPRTSNGKIRHDALRRQLFGEPEPSTATSATASVP